MDGAPYFLGNIVIIVLCKCVIRDMISLNVYYKVSFCFNDITAVKKPLIGCYYGLTST